MKAIGYKTSLPITAPESFIEFDTPTPSPAGRDLLVRVEAVSVNPVDTKIRQNSTKDILLETPKVIGWDAVGTVVEIGEEVSLFKIGDKVFYAGDITRSGSNAEYQLVDERIVGFKPESLSNEAAAAIPLTALTAWETLFDRMRLSAEKDHGKTLLIIGGAGGVGSLAIQLAKKILGLTVIATASRPESVEWCKKMGADVVVNHKNLVNEVREAGFHFVDFIYEAVDLNGYWDAIVELIKPQGHINSITGSGTPILLNKLKTKSVTFSWEFMYTRSSFQTQDMIEQHHILNRISELLEKGVLNSTHNQTIVGFTAESFKQAHAQLESGTTIGKLVVKY